MERFVFGVIGGTIVTAGLGGQFEMIHEPCHSSISLV